MKRGGFAYVLASVLIASFLAAPACFAADKVVTLKVANWFPIIPTSRVSFWKPGARTSRRRPTARLRPIIIPAGGSSLPPRHTTR